MTVPGRPLPRYLAAYLQHRQAVDYVARLAVAGAALYALSQLF